INLTLDSPTATAAPSGPVPGVLAVKGDCSFSLVAPFGSLQGFLAQNGTFAAGILESDGTWPILSTFQNQPISGSVELFKQNLSALGFPLPQSHINFSGVDLFSVLGAFQAEGSIGSTPAPLFLGANLGGFQIFGTGSAAVDPINSVGFTSGFQ